MEEWIIRLTISMQQERLDYVKRTEALIRARALLDQRNERIRELETAAKQAPNGYADDRQVERNPSEDASQRPESVRD